MPGIAGLVPLGLGIAFLLGIRWCEQIGRILGEADHPAIVWDEVVAMAAVLAFTPPAWPWLLAAFIVFRFFDIVKPWPICYVDRNMKHGLGVMLDDALAALFSIGVIQLALHVLPG
jgi:phosphatidylglycerophosphatase A